jgi:hypothetical protein
MKGESARALKGKPIGKLVHDMTPRHHKPPPKATVESCRPGDLAERAEQTLRSGAGQTDRGACGRPSTEECKQPEVPRGRSPVN